MKSVRYSEDQIIQMTAALEVLAPQSVITSVVGPSLQYRCPVCGAVISNAYRMICPGCGQCIDWSVLDITPSPALPNPGINTRPELRKTVIDVRTNLRLLRMLYDRGGVFDDITLGLAIEVTTSLLALLNMVR